MAPPTRTNLFICAIVEATDKIYSDLTGKFPVQSALGNKYILIVYHYNANAILADPLKDRTAKSIVSAHQRIYEYLTIRGLKPKFEILDNKCSHDLVKLMTSNKYILIVYHYDVNAIFAEPLKDRKAKSIASAHQRI